MEDKKKDITIYDIASRLNVSASTVSRALRNHQSIGKKTKKAVQELADEMGYRPNKLASSLRTNNSKTIGVLVSWINRPFIASLIAGIENAAREKGYQVIICQSHDNVELEKEYLRALYNSRVCALITSLAMKTKDYSHFDLFTKHNIPIVYVDRIPKIDSVNKVQINNYQASFEATEHLIQQGCTRIAHFGGDPIQRIYENRRNGYVAALERHNLPLDPSIIFQAEHLSVEEGTRLAQQALSIRPAIDGIVCANDTAAVSAIQYAKSQGIKIPEELAIIGFNNDPICEIIEPALSSVHHPAEQMGEAALFRALDIIKQEESEVDNITLGTHLIIRASSQRQIRNAAEIA
ncbi:MAG TPA: LacI family DNA-binding transcriptional regulator [Saprospiraceae bacterium]|nr:LacI family DNA-binding transcriptional regulator [Saprospiraceae bacterium]